MYIAIAEFLCVNFKVTMLLIYLSVPIFLAESFRVPHFYYGPNKDGFSLGSAMKNAEQVLGLNKWYWFLPVFTR